jgi:hypothetical protein
MTAVCLIRGGACEAVYKCTHEFESEASQTHLKLSFISFDIRYSLCRRASKSLEESRNSNESKEDGARGTVLESVRALTKALFATN